MLIVLSYYVLWVICYTAIDNQYTWQTFCFSNRTKLSPKHEAPPSPPNTSGDHVQLFLFQYLLIQPLQNFTVILLVYYFSCRLFKWLLNGFLLPASLHYNLSVLLSAIKEFILKCEFDCLLCLNCTH